jgi:transcriptional regulator with XRE-family HTH domain
MEMRETLARNLKKYRRAQGLSQEELGHRAELDRTYVSSIERCVYSATVDVVGRLAAALGIPPLELLRDPSTEPRSAPPPAERAGAKSRTRRGVRPVRRKKRSSAARA